MTTTVSYYDTSALVADSSSDPLFKMLMDEGSEQEALDMYQTFYAVNSLTFTENTND
jgi:hypothetical protein